MAPDEDINSAAESERLVCVSIKVEEEDKEQKNQENKPLWDTMLDTWYMLGPRVRTHILQLFFFIICLAAILPWVSEAMMSDGKSRLQFSLSL